MFGVCTDVWTACGAMNERNGDCGDGRKGLNIGGRVGRVGMVGMVGMVGIVGIVAIIVGIVGMVNGAIVGAGVVGGAVRGST